MQYHRRSRQAAVLTRSKDAEANIGDTSMVGPQG
jgi:hypothetical protein